MYCLYILTGSNSCLMVKIFKNNFTCEIAKVVFFDFTKKCNLRTAYNKIINIYRLLQLGLIKKWGLFLPASVGWFKCSCIFSNCWRSAFTKSQLRWFAIENPGWKRTKKNIRQYTRHMLKTRFAVLRITAILIVFKQSLYIH